MIYSKFWREMTLLGNKLEQILISLYNSTSIIHQVISLVRASRVYQRLITCTLQNVINFWFGSKNDSNFLGGVD